ncbi:MAG TPA: flavodoxin [Oceanospirillaceae bacterium]|nr:flavodoxin [Oceanospirillaceae bacterium]
MKQLLLICHTPSANTQVMAAQLLAGAQAEATENSQVRMLTPTQCGAEDLLNADALVFLTTENLGYMAGTTKDLFDRTFYDLEGPTQGLSYALVVRAGLDGTGATRAVESICGGLNWKPIQARLLCHGQWRDDFGQQCYELGQMMMASMDMGII